MRQFNIITLGCRVNQCESDSLAGQLITQGWTVVPTSGDADLVIVNTCAVTGKAAMQSRQAIRQARRANPDARIIVTGCYAQIAGDEIRETTGEQKVVGHADKFRIPDIVGKSTHDGNQIVQMDDTQTRKSGFDPVHILPGSGRTRPVLKIQDGCNAYCTYCIVPYARGRSRSMPPDDAVANIQVLAAAGYHEVVLSGIHLGCFGLDQDPKTTLHDLLGRIEAETTIDRIRLSSIEPRELTDDVIDRLAGSNRFCRHFHIPLQSGSNAILDKMHRPYTAEFFEDRVLQIKERLPDAAIGVDVLVGFPGETDDQFEETFDLIGALPVTYLHVFPFSPRAGTPAAKMPHHVTQRVVNERCERLRKLGRKKRRVFYEGFVGRRLEVLIEETRDAVSGHLKGTTSNYIAAHIEGADDLRNTIQVCRGMEVIGDSALRCEVV